ncbi:hypothetical protein EDD37DRAFT_23295 [Exophiala viscosa]|uniref:uncharacterized protein n=1 Tax=Exophiala viscosa TaxID=2486360 RepID=UPI00219A8102|nr:hypothetical protein EDD37DRAFT_23295 [Exophiala viscosa]
MATTYLITGASRGLGRGLVETYLSRPSNTVVAAVRDPSSHTSQTLYDLPRGPSSSLIVVKIDSHSEADAEAAVEELHSLHKITALDVVVANAGIAEVFPRVEDALVADLLEDYQVNVIAVIVLFRAVLPLLKSSAKTAKFVTIGSSAGTIGDMDKIPVPNAVYGTSKAALNYVTKKIHLENEDIVAFPVHPGWAQTDNGNHAARLWGLEKAAITVEESVAGLVNIIDGSTRGATSGKFMQYDGTTMAW